MSNSHITPSRSFIYILILPLQLLFSGICLADDITRQQLLERLDTNTMPLLLDVRMPEEYSAGHIPYAINIPHTELDNHLDKLRTGINSEIVVYCESGRRAAIALGILEQAGFTRVLHLQGDMNEWRTQGLPMVGGDSRSIP